MQEVHTGTAREPCLTLAVRRESFQKETRMKTLVWAGVLYLPFLDLFWWLR